MDAKLDMKYTVYRYAGCEITEEEKKYIANDILAVKEALETANSIGRLFGDKQQER